MDAWTRCLLLLTALGFACTARADSTDKSRAKPRYLVLPITRNDEGLARLHEFAGEVARRLAERGVRQVSHLEAASLFETAHSREPVPIAQEDIDVLLAESELASSASAQGRVSDAKKHVELAQRRASGALESLNRDQEAAQAYFDACLAQVRALLSDNDHDSALRVGRECHAAVPDLNPSPRKDPPGVMKLFAEVKNEVQSRGTGLLRVESEPSECRVIVNGRFLGRTPYQQRAPLGQRSKLQVECGETMPGRVHEITFGEEPVALDVNTFFEHSVRTSRGILRLTYERAEDPSVRAHAKVIRDLLNADQVLLVSTPSPGQFALHRVGHTETTISARNTPDELNEALEFLLSSPATASTPLDDDSSARVDHFPARKARPRPKYPRWRLAAGLTLSGIGLGTSALGVWRYVAHLDHGRAFRASQPSHYAGAQRRWNDSRFTPYVLVGLGIASLSTGALVLAKPIPPRHRKWLAPTAGAAAGILTTSGAITIVRGDACDAGKGDDRRFCARDQERKDLGALVLMSAAPFLSLSLTEFIEWLRGTDGSREAVVHTNGRTVDLTVRF